MDSLSQMLRDFAELFFPELCITCDDRLVSQEKYVCMKCWFDLPVTRFGDDEYNRVAQLFWGRVQVEHAASWFHYRKGSRYQELIHSIKYKGLKELGLLAGRKFGESLAESAVFNSADMIVQYRFTEESCAKEVSTKVNGLPAEFPKHLRNRYPPATCTERFTVRRKPGKAVLNGG